MINFPNFFITPPKTFQLSLGVAGKRNIDFVSFVTILPIFAAKRPDYFGGFRMPYVYVYAHEWRGHQPSATFELNRNCLRFSSGARKALSAIKLEISTFLQSKVSYQYLTIYLISKILFFKDHIYLYSLFSIFHH